MNFESYKNIKGTNYIVTHDLKIINKKTGNENRSNNVSVLMNDGIRHTFTRNRLIYCTKNDINHLSIPKSIIIDKNGNAIDRYEFYKKHKCFSVIRMYHFDIELHEKIIDCIRKGTHPLFLMDYLKEIESYCKYHLRVNNDEAHELSISAIIKTIDNIENKIYPQSIIGYMNGIAKKLLADRRKSTKKFLNKLYKKYE